MRVKSIQFENFRNYKKQEIKLDAGTNLIYGDNAQGKTNILEAVYVCGTTKSHRGGKDSEMVMFGEEESHLRMEIERDEVPYRIDMHLKKGKAKGIAVNGSPVRKASELMGLCHFIFFSPEDLGIIKDGPSVRRRFMDMELCQLNKSYVSSLSLYQKVLDQRNRLLKDLRTRNDLYPTLDVWDEQLVRYGRYIIGERERFAASLNDVIAPVHRKLTGGAEEIRAVYEKNVDEDRFEEALRSGRGRDIQLGMTLTGPHRDDLSILSNGIDLKKYGTQGQQRTAALSLKLAEIELVRQAIGDMPVLLLDDVLSELDSGRQHFLLESIRDIQTLITCTGVEDFRKNGFRIDSLFYVRQGEVRME